MADIFNDIFYVHDWYISNYLSGRLRQNKLLFTSYFISYLSHFHLMNIWICIQSLNIVMKINATIARNEYVKDFENKWNTRVQLITAELS